ncbi:MAG: carboxypeptidase-like regulatory domain-containing protein, partial [Bryobacteraceae bacterium]
MNKARCARLLASFAFLLCSSLSAQSNFATLTGSVTDSTGAAVPKATLEAVNRATNFRYHAQSDDSGNYTVVNLLEGVYRLKATAAGFQEYVVDGIELASREARRVDIKMQLGQVSTVVEVSGGASLIETEMARVSDIKERVVLRALPMTLRRIHDMWAVQPGAYNGRLGGSRNKQRDFALDGVTLSSATGGQTTGVMTDRTEAFEEVRIDVAGTTAEFAGLGQVAVTTRAGSNKLHGSAFEYYQTPRLISRNPFSAAGTGSVEHIPGGAVGGPVYIPKLYNGRDRTFFFTSIETERLGSPGRTNRQLSVPLEAWRRGDFSALLPATPVRDPFANNAPFAGNIIPATRLNPVAVKMQERYPLPNFGDQRVFAAQNYREIQLTDKHKNPTFTARLDHRFSEKTLVFARLTEIYWTQDGRDGSGLDYYGWTTAYRSDRAVNANLTHVFQPKLIAEIRWGYAFDITPNRGNIMGLQDIRTLGLRGLADNLPDVPGSFAAGFTGLGLTGLSSTSICDPCNFNRKQHYQGHVS